jgi:hypothetical protein
VKIEVKEVLITPERAAGLLKKHFELLKSRPQAKNRHLDKARIEIYSRDMSADNWELNGETIKRGADGRLIDGQHRLHACVKSGKPFKTLMVENAPDDAFKTIDIGKGRTIGDTFGIEGYRNGAMLGAALSFLWRWEQGDGKYFSKEGKSPSKQEIREVLDRHPELPEFVNKSHALAKIMSGGMAATLWYLFSKKDDVLADLFFQSLVTGLNMTQDDPVYILRERLLKERGMKPRPSVYSTAEFVMRSWTATRRGEKLTKLQTPRVDSTKKGGKNNRFGIV